MVDVGILRWVMTTPEIWKELCDRYFAMPKDKCPTILRICSFRRRKAPAELTGASSSALCASESDANPNDDRR